MVTHGKAFEDSQRLQSDSPTRQKVFLLSPEQFERQLLIALHRDLTNVTFIIRCMYNMLFL